MKKVWFVQANDAYGSSYYFPYATGCMAAYAWQFDSIRNSYDAPEFLFKRTPVDIVTAELDEPSVMAFSCFVWTFEYCKKLAETVKNKYPRCLIVFGGHYVTEKSKLLEELPFVDVLLFGEGERPFKELLEYVSGAVPIESVPNISYRVRNEIIINPFVANDSLDDLPSPYLEGVFDKMYAEHPEIDFSATIETNRGCPYNCSYCDWSYSKHIREFPIEKIKAEIKWCGEHKLDYVFCADSNFGILKRDLEIAKHVAAVKRETGFPRIFNADYAKNSNETVFEISKLFFANKISKGVTISLQTISKRAMECIGRENLSIEDFSELMKKYNENGLPTYTEMILGLPGETYDSFCEGLCAVLEAGQQHTLSVFNCEVYPNSRMGSEEYRKKYGIQTARLPLNVRHRAVPEDEITEYTDVIIATADMPFEDTLKALMFSTCLQCFHYIGLLKYFALYLRYEQEVSYYSFYSLLFNYISAADGSFLNRLFRKLHEECRTFKYGEWTYFDPKFGNNGWFLEEGAFMGIAGNIDTFWNEITPFLRTFGIEEEMFAELLKYQKFSIRLPGQERLISDFAYDFYSYFNNAVSFNYKPLVKQPITIEVNIPDPVYNWEDYATKVMLFAKKRGRTIVLSDPNDLTVTRSVRSDEKNS